jgi:hypothetical protein
VTRQPLEGFGAQLNTNLFITRGATAGEPRPLTAQQLAQLQAAIDNLQPGFSRILVRRGLRADTAAGRGAPEFVALLKTVELAQHAGAELNLTFWGQGPYADERRLRALRWPNKSFRDWPDPHRRKWPPELMDPRGITQPRVLMERFAGVLHEIRRRGFDCVTSVTVQNEVNGAGIDIAKQRDQNLSMRLYELLYRFLDTALRELADPLVQGQTMRDALRFIAGDLVERGNSTQDVWLRYLHRNMEVPRPQFPSVLDGYSIHVYWEPTGGAQGFPAKPERRLAILERTAGSLGLAAPIYVTEYGVRQVRARVKPGRIGSVRIDESPLAAFQHGWFNAIAAQRGCVGISKWVLYRTDKAAGFGEWGMIGPPAGGFARFPVYRVTRLFSHFVPRGWLANGLSRVATNVITSRFAALDGSDVSVLVLNNASRGRQLKVQGLRANQSYFVVAWNRDGHGSLASLPPLQADATGAATVQLPAHGIVALSTRDPGF